MLVAYVLACFDTYLLFFEGGVVWGHDFSAVCQIYPLRPQFVVMQNYTFSLYCLHASAAVAFPLTQSAGDNSNRRPTFELLMLRPCDM